MKRTPVLPIAILAALLLPNLAIAQPAREVPARARELAKLGRELHEKGDYAGAVQAYTEAYALAPAPALLFDLAQAYRLAGRCDDAAVMYRRFLQADPDQEARALAEAHLINVDRCREPRPNFVDNGALLDGHAVAASHVALRDEGTGNGLDISKRQIGVGLAIAGGVSMGFAAVYAWKSHDAANEVSDGFAHGSSWTKLGPIDARGRHDQTVAEITGVVGIAAIATGAVFYYLGGRESNRAVAVAPHGRGAEVQVGWRF